jgi:hypothetical protein
MSCLYDLVLPSYGCMVHTWYGSTMRNSETMSDDLPLPVRPQMPTFSPAAMLKVTPCGQTSTQGLRLQNALYTCQEAQ